MSAVEQRDPRHDLVARVRSDDFRAEIKLALPESVSVDRFTRATVTALMTTPDLIEADRTSLLQALIRCAQMGLMPDGRQAAITVFNTKVKTPQGDQWIKKAQCLAMIGGVRDILAEYGWTLRTRVVYANDEFDYTEEPPTLTHRSVRPGAPRGDLIAAYAIAVHRDGRREQRVLHPEDVAKRRGVAKTQKVWETWTGAMWEKSAGHALAKALPLDPADQRIHRITESSELEPAERVTLMYRPQVPAGSPPPPTLIPGGGDSEAGEAAPDTGPSSDAASPGPDPDADNIPFGNTAAGVGMESESKPEPEPEPEPEPDTPTKPPYEKALADAAAEFVPPSGKYAQGGSDGPKTLGQILADDPTYIAWILRKVTEPRDYAQAAWLFAKVYAPETYQKVLAEREARA